MACVSTRLAANRLFIEFYLAFDGAAITLHVEPDGAVEP